MLDKKSNVEHVQTTAGYRFSKNTNCDIIKFMRFLVIEINTNDFGFALQVFSDWKQQTLSLLV